MPIPIRDADVNRTSEKIYSYAKFSIHPGKLAEFKRLAFKIEDGNQYGHNILPG